MDRSLFLLCHALAFVGVDVVNGWRVRDMVGCNDAKKQIVVPTAEMRHSRLTFTAATCVVSLQPIDKAPIQQTV